MEGEDTSIPEATPAPLVIDVEFVEKEITAPKPRDIGQAQIRQHWVTIISQRCRDTT